VPISVESVLPEGATGQIGLMVTMTVGVFE